MSCLQWLQSWFKENSNLVISNISEDKESREYSAACFTINSYKILYRQSKITPTKTGQFVSIWKRNSEAITKPFDIADDFDFIMIASKKDEQTGIFIFPKQALAKQGIISINNKNGKRGIRVYPTWDIAENKQAIKTQQWQCNFFIDFSSQNIAATALANYFP